MDKYWYAEKGQKDNDIINIIQVKNKNNFSKIIVLSI